MNKILPILCSAALLVSSTGASGFAGYVAPARFELEGKPGQVVRQVIDIGNDGAVADEFSVKTADWQLTRTGGVHFDQALAEKSCRPWVQIERHTVKLAPRAKRKFRFEMHVPANATPQECRFAILVERNDDVLPTVVTGNIQMPLSGRIGVIVYLKVGDVKPRLEVRNVRLDRVNGVPMPVLDIENTGSAHGRLEGILEGIDANNQRIEFTVSNFPILAGEKRTILVSPQDTADGKRPAWVPPLRLKGELEWAGGKWPINVELK